jgi:DNA ligase-1
VSNVKFKPLLAETVDDIADLRYPLLASIKLDGIRAVVRDGVLLSRSLKPIPNRYVQSILGRPEFNGLDGELMVNGTFQAVTSAFMSEDGEPDFYYAVFDNTQNPGLPFAIRLATLDQFPTSPHLRKVVQVDVRSASELQAVYERALAEGHEGIMVRSLEGRYKHGRSTLREGILLKWKPFADSEATVVGFEERMHNGNEATTNALGRTERSSHQANLVPMGTLGALVCSNQAKWPGVTFNVGTGFDDATRAKIWANRSGYIGATIRFKFQAIGTVDKPRIPVFEGLRSAEDMS